MAGSDRLKTMEDHLYIEKLQLCCFSFLCITLCMEICHGNNNKLKMHPKGWASFEKKIYGHFMVIFIMKVTAILWPRYFEDISEEEYYQ